MKYIKKLDRVFYSVEMEHKYFISDMNGLCKRITEEEYHRINNT